MVARHRKEQRATGREHLARLRVKPRLGNQIAEDKPRASRRFLGQQSTQARAHETDLAPVSNLGIGEDDEALAFGLRSQSERDRRHRAPCSLSKGKRLIFRGDWYVMRRLEQEDRAFGRKPQAKPPLFAGAHDPYPIGYERPSKGTIVPTEAPIAILVAEHQPLTSAGGSPNANARASQKSESITLAVCRTHGEERAYLARQALEQGSELTRQRCGEIKRALTPGKREISRVQKHPF